ncbi:Variant-specific surface protein, partial [Giardia duodenalis]
VQTAERPAGGVHSHLPLHVQGRISRLVGQIRAASDSAAHLSNDTGPHPPLGGCHSINTAPGSGVCRETWGGACVGYAEGMRIGQTAGACTDADAGGNCASGSCTVQIGDNLYCSQCSNGGSLPSSPAPTNGVCTTDNNECSVKADGRCTTCAQESFMFKGGCYRADQTPGQSMCTQAANGKCTAAAAGNSYFIPPNADASHDSVVACNDTTEITLTDGKKYVGVANCLTCTKPADGNTGTPTAATCTKCADGYFGDACTACDDDNCAACAATGKNQCSKCKTTGTKTYLKVESGSTGTCVEASQCGPTAFPKDDSTNGNKCAACSTVADGGIANCAECSLLTAAGRVRNTLITCTKCSTKKLSPLKDACLDSCPAGTYDDNNVCKPCHVSCAECNSNANQDSCTACYPGHVLNRTTDSGSTGTCIPECTGRYAESCEANQCTAELGARSTAASARAGSFLWTAFACRPEQERRQMDVHRETGYVIVVQARTFCSLVGAICRRRIRGILFARKLLMDNAHSVLMDKLRVMEFAQRAILLVQRVKQGSHRSARAASRDITLMQLTRPARSALRTVLITRSLEWRTV